MGEGKSGREYMYIISLLCDEKTTALSSSAGPNHMQT